MVVEVIDYNCAWWRALIAHKGMIVPSIVYMARHPRGRYMVYILLSLELATPENKSSHSTLSSICKKVRTRCPSPPHKRFLVGCNSPCMRRAQHLTALRTWCNVCLVGEKPTCPAPALKGCEGLRPNDYGHA